MCNEPTDLEARNSVMIGSKHRVQGVRQFLSGPLGSHPLRLAYKLQRAKPEVKVLRLDLVVRLGGQIDASGDEGYRYSFAKLLENLHGESMVAIPQCIPSNSEANPIVLLME